MKIEIKHTDSKKASKLLNKFLTMNEKSEYNYLEKDSLYIGYNSNSGFSYIYLENYPAISLCLDNNNDFCIGYSSSLDGLEFIKYNIPSNLDKLETLLNKAYTLEDEIRGDNYNDWDLSEKFINKMITKKWQEL